MFDKLAAVELKHDQMMAEMAEAIGKVDTISPAACKQAAERRFSKKRMIDGYFDLYRRILQEGPRCSAVIR